MPHQPLTLPPLSPTQQPPQPRPPAQPTVAQISHVQQQVGVIRIITLDGEEGGGSAAWGGWAWVGDDGA